MMSVTVLLRMSCFRFFRGLCEFGEDIVPRLALWEAVWHCEGSL